VSAREEVIAELDRAAERIDAALAGLDDIRASKKAKDGWSIKDQLTHITFWHEMRYFEVVRIARGGRASFPHTSEDGVGAINDQMVKNRAGLSLEQIVADLQFARQMVRDALHDAPDSLDMSHFEEIGPNGARHEFEHAEYIDRLRKEENL
jgi:hypothetical protein